MSRFGLACAATGCKRPTAYNLLLDSVVSAERRLVPHSWGFSRSASRWLAVMAGAWLCAGCAGPSSRLPDLPEDEVKAERHRQQVAQIQDYYGALARLDNVAFRIRTAKRPLLRQGLGAARAQRRHGAKPAAQIPLVLGRSVADQLESADRDLGRRRLAGGPRRHQERRRDSDRRQRGGAGHATRPNGSPAGCKSIAARSRS